MGKSKRVGIYMRVSTADQTVENQRIDLERVAEQRNWLIVETYIDHGISGAKGRDKRPAFDKLCKDASQGKLDIVAAWAIDRIGRSIRHVAVFMEELQEQNVTLYLHQQNIDGTTTAGRAMLGMASVFAAFERDMLRERINAGLARARSQGKKLGRETVITPQLTSRIRALRAKGYGKIRIGRAVGCGTGTVQKVLS